MTQSVSNHMIGTRIVWLIAAGAAVVTWAIAWVTTRGLDPGNQSVDGLYVLAGASVLAGTTARFGGGLTLGGLLMTAASLLVGWDLPTQSQVRSLLTLGMLITASLAAQAMAQQLQRGRPEVEPGALAARTAATLGAAAVGAAVTAMTIRLVLDQTLESIVIPVGLGIAAVGLIGMRWSLGRGGTYGSDWLPPPPQIRASPMTGIRVPPPPPAARPQRSTSSPPPPPLDWPEPAPHPLPPPPPGSRRRR